MKKFNTNKPFNDLPNLPPKVDLHSKEITQLVIRANKLLAELKGYSQTLPDPHILLNTIILQESKESNAIENIVTTQDELYKASIDDTEKIKNQAAKEVILYREAIYLGVEELNKKGILSTNLVIAIMQKLRSTNENIRKIPGVKLANPITQSVVYTPPEGEAIIREKLAALEQFINNDSLSDLDELIKMALIHYQFEAIHPFSDGNGRTGRILNILYLINKGLLSLPILYLSKYIIKNKNAYYLLLRGVTENGDWESWVKYILNGVAETAEMTLSKINSILELKEKSKKAIKDVLKSSYSLELIDILYSYPYIKVNILEKKGIAKRQTAADYLKKIEQIGLLKSEKIGKEVYYINTELLKILSE